MYSLTSILIDLIYFLVLFSANDSISNDVSVDKGKGRVEDVSMEEDEEEEEEEEESGEESGDEEVVSSFSSRLIAS